MIKIAFFDVDGTILRFGHKELSEKTYKALKSLSENGVLLCMTTGRSYTEIPHFEGIDFDVLATFNGSYVIRGDKVILRNPFNESDKKRIIQNLKEMKRAIAISNEELVVANGSDEDLAQYFEFGNCELNIVSNFDEICDSDIYQIMCSCRKEEHEQILRGTENALMVFWWDRAVDIIPKNSGKGNAVKAVLDYYGFSKDEAIAFGDGHNDVEMLEAVGTGVAMGNAKDDVKARATTVCRSVDDDGVYHYCVENNLIKFD